MAGQGRAQFAAFQLPSGSVVNEDISEMTLLDADKLEHLYKAATDFGLGIGGTPVAGERIVFVASTAGVIRGFHVTLADGGSNTDLAFDLKVNGASRLTGAVNYVHGDGSGTIKDGTLSSTALSPGDIVSISLAVTENTGAEGPFAWVEIEETAA